MQFSFTPVLADFLCPAVSSFSAPHPSLYWTTASLCVACLELVWGVIQFKRHLDKLLNLAKHTHAFTHHRRFFFFF